MAYQDLLSEESIDSQFLVIMRPRRIFSPTWELVSGNIYKAGFEFGQITHVTSDGEALTEAASTSVVLNEWYFDEVAATLYINIAANPSTHVIIPTYELYLSTVDAHYFRIPDDDTSRVVYYEPLVSRSPSIVSSASDVLFGFLPTFSSQISINNVTNYLQVHLYDSSFNRAEIEIWHYLGDLEVDNLRLVLKGYTAEISISDKTVSFSMQDATSFFNSEWRQPLGPSFYSAATFPDLDPNFLGRPVRQVFGVVDGFVPVNIDYVITDPTTSDNRTWVCIADETNLGTVSTTANAGGTHTATRTYLTSADGIRVGDTIWNSATSEGTTVTAVNKTGANYVDHASWTVASNTNPITRYFVGSVTLFKDGSVFDLIYNVHYQSYIDATNKVAGFTFINNFEALISSSILSPTDLVVARVYGHKNTTTLGGLPFGANSTETGNGCSLVPLLWDTFKQVLPESALDAQGFEDLEAVVSDELGFAVPALSISEFPTIKDLISQFCQTALLKIFLDNDLLWSVWQLAPLTTSTKSIEDDEILEDSVSYKIKYQDLASRVEIQYAEREIGIQGGQGTSLVSAFESDVAIRLHMVSKQQSFKSLHYRALEADVLAERLSLIFGDRRGELAFTTKNRFFDTLLKDEITVSRDRMIGFEFSQDTLRSRSFVVTETKKSLTDIEITLDDIKGIEDATTWP
jgi:hypothetical protein